MINSPWNSTSLRQHKTDVIVSELAFASSAGRGIKPEGDTVSMVTPYADKVPVFIQPITKYELGNRKVVGENSVIIDARSFSKKDMSLPGEIIINNQTQFEFALRVGELTAYWINNESTRIDLMRAGDLPATVFISWISFAIANKLGLDEETARKLQIITGIYYAHLYHDAEVTGGNGGEKIAKLVNRWTRHPVDLVFATVEDTGYMNDLGDYIAEVKKAFSSNTRVAQVNVGLLISSLSNSWFGFGAAETIAVSMEYPPVFLALIEAALNSRVWKKSGIGRQVERFARGNLGTDFTRTLGMLVGRGRFPGQR